MNSNKPLIKHVIFDWSGTLYDDHLPSFRATKKIIKRLAGKNITFAKYKAEFTLPVLPFYRHYGINDSLAKLNQIYFDIYNDHFGEGELCAGVKECLRLLKKMGITMSVFSTVRQDILNQVCRDNKISDYFVHIQGSVCNKVKEMKGHIRRIKKSTHNILYIGDMDHDVDAANKNKIYSGCVINGYHNTEKLIQAHPRFVWRHQAEWIPFFKSLKNPLKAKKAIKNDAIPTSGALIVNKQGDVLLVFTHKWGYTYGIPGGKLKNGESIHAAAKREILEETGLKIDVKDLLMMQDCKSPSEFYIPNSHFFLYNYWATAKTENVKLNDESLSYLWIKPQWALNLHLNQPTRLLVKKYLELFQNQSNNCANQNTNQRNH